MFRRVVASASKLVAGVASVQVAATAVAISDADLKKKPEWYQHAVASLEESLKKLSTVAYIESEETLNAAHDVLQRVRDVDNTEILWRYARVLVEQAELSKCPHKKLELLEEAKVYAKKALALEPAKGSAGAHKWYAIAVTKLAQVDKKASASDAVEHFERATKLAPKDPFAWHLLGVAYYNQKKYTEAIQSFNKAEGIKSGFSPANLFYLGDSLKHAGQKKEAVEVLKKCLAAHTKNKADGRGKLEAKKVLSVDFKLQPEEYEPVPTEF
uniref:TPR_REGION domain-containing protein n=1 Tax=Steinernema glaseri TaxID=37863 RepID=A0A1I7ZAL5_9BILA